MRVIEAEEITKNVREMCIEANVHLSEDMEKVGSCVRILM